MLVDGDDMNEPIADAARSILDGHVVLSRSLAHAGHYPAIDVLQSVSRLVGEIVSPEVEQAGQRLRSALAVLREKEDLVAIGAYQPGTDRQLDAALAHRGRIEGFLRQRVHERSDPLQGDRQLLDLAGSLQGAFADAGDHRRRGGPPGGRLRAAARGWLGRRHRPRHPAARAEHLMPGRSAPCQIVPSGGPRLKNDVPRSINRP